MSGSLWYWTEQLFGPIESRAVLEKSIHHAGKY